MVDLNLQHIDELLVKTKNLNLNTNNNHPEKFQYTRLHDFNKIRLIELLPGTIGPPTCRINIFSLDDDDVPIYEALSYTWGAVVKTEKLYCQQGYLDVTNNLHSAFFRLRRKNSSRLLWVDAICVNQDDLAERGQQVQLMQRIYQQAKQVVVWLGDISDDSDLEKLEGGKDPAWTISKISGGSLYLPLSWLQHFNRPWFLRVWIIQEVAFAQKVQVIHGQQIIPWKDFATISKEYMVKRDVNDTSNYPHFNGDLKNAMILPYFISTVHKRFREKKPIPLLELLDLTIKFKATDLRDKIYALLSITTRDARQSLIPDYGISLSDVYIKLARYFVMESKSLRFLRYAQPFHRDKELPSWVPDWSRSTEKWVLFEQDDNVGDSEEDETQKKGINNESFEAEVGVDENFIPQVKPDAGVKLDEFVSCSRKNLTVKGLQVASIETISSRWIDKTETEASHEDLVNSLGSWYHSARSYPEFSTNRAKRVLAFWSTLQEAYARNVDEADIQDPLGYESHLKENFGTADEDPEVSQSASNAGSPTTSSKSSLGVSKELKHSKLKNIDDASIVSSIGGKKPLDDSDHQNIKESLERFDIHGDDEDSDDESDDDDYEDDSDDDESDSDSGEDDEDNSDEESDIENSEDDDSDTLSYDYSEVMKLDQYRLAPASSEEDDHSENGNIPSRETDSSGLSISSYSTTVSEPESSDTESHTNSCPAKGAWRSDPSSDDESDSPPSSNLAPKPLLFNRKDPTRPKCKVESSHGYSFSYCDCSCTNIDFDHHITPHEEAHDLFNPSSSAMHTPQAKQFLRDNANTICGRTFGFTTQGHMASLPGDARVTDLVCFFYGLRLPVVIRKVEPGLYELVGGCYVHVKWDWDMFEEEVEVENMDTFTLR